jgi:RecA/RadA recombinase
MPSFHHSLTLLLCHSLFIEEIEIFLERTCLQCAPKTCSALDLLQASTELQDIMDSSQCHSMRYLPTGLPGLDQNMLGGVRIGTITEVVGRAGSGKTQLALQLVVTAARYGQGAVYIDTERKVSLQRLQEMSKTRAKAGQDPALSSSSTPGKAFSYNMSSSSRQSMTVESQDDANPNLESNRTPGATAFPYKTAQQVLANLTVHAPGSTQELLTALKDTEDEILYRNQQAADPARLDTFPVRLLIVDSIAAPTKRDFGSDSAPQRASAVFQCAQILKRLADQLHLAVVVINQVGLGQENNNMDSSMRSSDNVSVRAALGTSWYHCVSTRLFMEHECDPHRLGRRQDEHNSMYQQQQQQGRIRRLTVVKSNLVGVTSTNFEVTTIGLEEVPTVSRDEEQDTSD